MSSHRLALSAALVVLTIAAYVPRLNGTFLWDDDEYITSNEALKSMSGFAAIWLAPGATPQYYPFVFSTFWVEYHLWGVDPVGYHVVNTLLQAVNAVLLWFVLRRLGVPGAWLAAAIFAVHPVQVESVAWVQERKNVLSGCFYFAAVLAFLRFARIDAEATHASDAGTPRRIGLRGWYSLALIFGVCAFFSKTATCTLPAALALVLWWKRDRLGAKEVLALLPFFALAIVSGLITVWVEKKFVGAAGEDWNLSGLERCLVAGRALWFYAGKLLWPARLAFIYPRWQIDARAWWQYAFPVGAIAVVAALWLLRRRIGKGPLVAALFYGGSLLPTLGFVNFYFMRLSFVADHFLYLASIGFVALATALLVTVLEGVRVPSQALPWAGAALLALLVFLTWNQEQHFRDPLKLWTDTLAKNPDCWLAHNNLGSALLARGDQEAAIQKFTAAIRINPGYPIPHYNLAKVFISRGDLEKAKKHLHEVIRLTPEGEHNARALLGLVYAQQHRFDEAIQYLAEETRLHPGSADAMYNLGVVHVQQKNCVEARACFRQACALRPSEPEYHLALAETLTHLGAHAEAQQHRNMAQRLRQFRP